VQPGLGDAAGGAFVVVEDQRVQPAGEGLLVAEQVGLSDFPASAALLEEVVVLAVTGGLEFVVGAGAVFVVVVLVVVVVAVDDRDQLLQLFALAVLLWGDLLVADVQQVLNWAGGTFRVSSVSIM
jgi:hypothetical protein